MAYPGNYRQQQPANPNYQQQPPRYAAYGAPPGGGRGRGGYPYGAPPGGPAMGRGAPGGPAMGRGYQQPQRGYPPQAQGGYPPGGPPGGVRYPPQQQGGYRPQIVGRPLGEPQPVPRAGSSSAMGRGGGPMGMGRGGPAPQYQPKPQPRPGGQPAYFGGGRPGGPAMLKRQASQLRSAYPNSRFCRVFLSGGSSSSGGGVSIPPDMLSEVPRCSVNYTFDYEQTVLREAVSSRDREMSENTQVQSRVQERESETADSQMRKIASLASITGRSEADCRQLLVAANWDLQRATAQVFSSNENVMEGAAPVGGMGGGPDTDITVIFPDQARLMFRVKASDTFWELYGRVIQGKPDYASRGFNFRLGSGRTLNDSNFDETFTQNFLTPAATIWVINA